MKSKNPPQPTQQPEQHRYKTLKLSEILNKDEMKIVMGFINKDQWSKLRDYLQSIEKELLYKDVVADYLYYFLVMKFKARGEK